MSLVQYYWRIIKEFLRHIVNMIIISIILEVYVHLDRGSHLNITGFELQIKTSVPGLARLKMNLI